MAQLELGRETEKWSVLFGMDDNRLFQPSNRVAPVSECSLWCISCCGLSH
jgi:hypothetical protein